MGHSVESPKSWDFMTLHFTSTCLIFWIKHIPSCLEIFVLLDVDTYVSVLGIVAQNAGQQMLQH